MKKRNCNGYKALDTNYDCELSFVNIKRFSLGFVVGAIPFEECPKPKSIKKYIYLAGSQLRKRKNNGK